MSKGSKQSFRCRTLNYVRLSTIGTRNSTKQEQHQYQHQVSGNNNKQTKKIGENHNKNEAMDPMLKCISSGHRDGEQGERKRGEREGRGERRKEGGGRRKERGWSAIHNVTEGEGT